MNAKVLLFLIAAFTAWAGPAAAQNTTGYVVAACGTVPTTWTPGRPGPFTVDTNGRLCGNTSVSIAGFQPGASGTPISVTTGGATGTLPAGAVVVATNVGTTNGAYCALGASASTADQYIAPNGGWFAFTVGGATQLTCVTGSSTTTVNMVGGSGIPTGTGGGGGGGGSFDGNITQLGGNAIATNTGSSSAGTQRVVLASDTPGLIPDAATTSAATAPATGIATLGVYLSTPPTLTNGQSVGLQLSASGALLGQIMDAAGNARGVNVTAANQAQVLDGASAATGAAPPAATSYIGANASGATGGLLRGLVTCDSYAKYDGSDNGSITLVTGVSGRKVYICGFTVSTGGTATTLKLREGSDANCASNAADITPGWAMLANDMRGVNSPFWNGLVVSTNAYYVCINASAGNAHTAQIWYSIL